MGFDTFERVSNPTDNEWLDLLARSVTEKVTLNGMPLPAFPPENIQVTTVGQVGVNAVRQAWNFALGALKQFELSPLFSKQEKTLLDFGCSWGRISRCFLRDFKVRNITGIDVSSCYIHLCREIFPDLKVERCNVFPPTNLKPGRSTSLLGIPSSLIYPSGVSGVGDGICGTLELWWHGCPYDEGSQFFRHTPKPRGWEDGRSTGIPYYDAAKAKYDRGEIAHSDTEWRRVNRNHLPKHSFRTVCRDQVVAVAISRFLRRRRIVGHDLPKEVGFYLSVLARGHRGSNRSLKHPRPSRRLGPQKEMWQPAGLG